MEGAVPTHARESSGGGVDTVIVAPYPMGANAELEPSRPAVQQRVQQSVRQSRCLLDARVCRSVPVLRVRGGVAYGA